MEVTPPLGSDILVEHDCYEALGERGIESRVLNIFSNTKDMNLQRGETEIIRENSKQMSIIWALLFPADVTCVLYEVEVLWQIWEYMKKICFKDVNEELYQSLKCTRYFKEAQNIISYPTPTKWYPSYSESW